MPPSSTYSPSPNSCAPDIIVKVINNVSTHVQRYTQTTNIHTHTLHSYLKAGSSLLHLGGGDENAFLLLKSFWKRVGGILYQNKFSTEGLVSFQIQEQILFLVTVSMDVTVI